MRRRPVSVRWVCIVVVALFAGIQFYPRVTRDNPPVTGGIRAPDEVLRILRRSCFDCHSHETRWPWYSRVAPVSWFIGGHVAEGREHVNFSTWEADDPMSRLWNVGEIVRKVEVGEMPPPSYLWIHRAARPDREALERLRLWAASGD